MQLSTHNNGNRPSSTSSPVRDLSMSGEDRGGEDSPASSRSVSQTSSPPPSQDTGSKHGTTARDGPDPETKYLIQELMEVAHIKSTNKRIKIIATQIRDALLNIQRPSHRTAFRPEIEEVLRYHESIMAELMQELDNQEKPSIGTSDLVTIQGITHNLVDHWGMVKAAMHEIFPQPSPGPGFETSISPLPSPSQVPANVPQFHSPSFKPANDISLPKHFTTIKKKLAEQDHKINKILSLLQNSDRRRDPNDPSRSPSGSNTAKKSRVPLGTLGSNAYTATPNASISNYRSIYSTPSTVESPLSSTPTPGYPSKTSPPPSTGFPPHI